MIGTNCVHEHNPHLFKFVHSSTHQIPSRQYQVGRRQVGRYIITSVVPGRQVHITSVVPGRQIHSNHNRPLQRFLHLRHFVLCGNKIIFSEKFKFLWFSKKYISILKFPPQSSHFSTFFFLGAPFPLPFFSFPYLRVGILPLFSANRPITNETKLF